MNPIRLRSLRSKLLIAFGVLALAPLVVLSVLSTRESTDKLEALAGEHLSARAMTVANAFAAYLDERQADVALFVRHPAAFDGTPAALATLADSYIDLASAYDLIVVADADGKIVATNTHTGDRKAISGLVGKSVRGQAWFDTTSTSPAGTHYMSPGAEFDPFVAQATHSDGKGVTFATGIFDEHGQLVRVWANHISWERSITAIVRRELDLMKSTGIKTAQIDVMDRSGRLQDEAPVIGEIPKLDLLATSPAAQASVRMTTGYAHEVDPIDHNDDMVGYAQVPRPNGWIVLTHETAAEVASSADGLRHFAWIVGLCAGAFVVFGSIWFAGGLTRRLAAVVRTLERVADGDLTARAPMRGSDEIASMTRALHGALDRIGGAFGSIGDGILAVSKASEGLTAVGATLSASAQDTSRQAGVVATASEQAGKNVQTVAAGTEEMSVTIKEVAKNAAEAARVATAAVGRAERTNALVRKLGESSAEIGNVLKVITSIAEQTNLLALNATIEAARAGEAGKGFAVVANEVKELAKETARATDDITRKIAAIQTDTTSAVAAIGEITLVIGQINDIQSTIASAVEQQAATTNEIGRNLHELAEASNEIAQNVTSVAASAGSTSECSQQTRSAATGLADLSRSLDDQMRQFRFKRVDAAAPVRHTTGTLVRVPAIAFEGATAPGMRH